MDRGVVGEDAVVSHWRTLTNSALPEVRVRARDRSEPSVSRSLFCFQKLLKPFQLQAQRAAAPLAELQSRRDVLQVSPQTVEGAT